MSFKLQVHALRGGESFEKECDQPSLCIGRDMQCEVVLQDIKSLVSREHAMIREKEGRYVLIDLESKNKTKLNQHILTSRKEYPLEENDHIRIGDFELTIIAIRMPSIVQEVKPRAQLKEGNSEATPKIEAVLFDLNRVFTEHRYVSSEERKKQLLSVLREALDGLETKKAESLLKSVESSFRGLADEDNEITKVPQEDERPLQNSEVAACRKAYDGLLKISKNYLDDKTSLKTTEEIDRFVDRIDKVMSVMFASLANALKGRRQFEQEFDVEATRIFSWGFNPVKECDSGKKIGAYLLDTEKEPSIEKGITNLEEGFNDLALHHLGLIAGLNECLRGLLDQLLPDTFEVESQKPEAVSIWMRPFIRFEPFRSWAAWKQFRKKYTALREEEVKTFETILGPYIAKGYLSVQKKKQNP